MKKTLLVAMIVAAALAGPAAAQTDPHHPDQSVAQGTQSQKNSPMGQGMMSGQAMMAQGMMMNCPMMGMMGSGGPHTEGRLAFLKTELKITDAQEKAWKTYADTVRAIDKKRASGSGTKGAIGGGMMNQGMMGGGMMQPASTMSAPETLGKRAQILEDHLKNLRDLQAATKKLYRGLDETQKKTADELLAMPCCIGAM